MAGHRSPRVRCTRRSGVTVSALVGRHQVAHRPAPTGSSLRNTAAVSAAAVGALATGVFAVLLPTPLDGTATTADAAEGAAGTALAANSAPLTTFHAGAVLLPVAYSVGLTEDEVADKHLELADKAGRLAEELSRLHAQQAREQVELARIAALVDEGGVDGWIAEALQIMDLPQSLAPAVKRIIMAESGGNPRAVNTWDSNAARGTPSQGLMQTIPSTYRAFVHPELADRPITDPVANITAGVRYMIATYGLETLEAGGRTTSSGGYVGY